MTRTERVTGWRRIASAMWDPPNDPQIYGALDVDARPLVAFLEEARALGHRVTPTHLVGRAVAHALEAVPELNVRIRRGRAKLRSSVDIFFITAVRGGNDLSGVKIADVPHKSVVEVAAELNPRAATLRTGRDPELHRTKRMTDALPPRLLRRMLHATAFLTEDLGVDVPLLALHKEPFGSAMITSIGMFGLPSGFAPLAWMYDVPLLVLVGELVERPVVEDGAVVARMMLPISATIDHRYVDGSHVSRAMRAFREYLAAPADFEPLPKRAIAADDVC